MHHSSSNRERGDYIYALKLYNNDSPVWKDIDDREETMNEGDFLKIVKFNDAGDSDFGGGYYNYSDLKNNIQNALNDLFNNEKGSNIIYMFRNKIMEDDGTGMKWETVFSDHPNWFKNEASEHLKFNHDYSRVWIRKDDMQGWVLINGLIEREKNDITSFIAKSLFNNDDFIFCYRNELDLSLYNNKSNKKIYIPDIKKYLYNYEYDIEKILSINPSVNSNDIIIDSVNLESIFEDRVDRYPKFVSTNSSSREKVNIDIKSNEIITEYFDKFIQNGLNNIYIENGTMIDCYGNSLDKQYVYLSTDGGLIGVNPESVMYKIQYNQNYVNITEPVYNTLYANSSIPEKNADPLCDKRLGETGGATDVALSYDEVQVFGSNTTPIGFIRDSHITGEGFNSSSDRVENDGSHVGQRR